MIIEAQKVASELSRQDILNHYHVHYSLSKTELEELKNLSLPSLREAFIESESC